MPERSGEAMGTNVNMDSVNQENQIFTYDEALTAIEAWLAQSSEPDLVVLSEFTLERPFGWVFFYNSRQFVQTGDFKYQLLGNAPLIFNRFTGEIIVTGTARPIEQYIAEFEKSIR